MISLSVEKQAIRHDKQIAMNDGLLVEHIEELIPIDVSSGSYREIYDCMNNGIKCDTLVHIGCSIASTMYYLLFIYIKKKL